MRTSSRVPLVLIAAVAALGYAWGSATQQPEIFYAAAARSMSQSWHNFFFAAFDPAATMSVDKLPGALWLQALSVRLFGVHMWALNLPQIVEGVATVFVLHRAVRRVAGDRAALVAALVYALTPATIGLNRGNVSDSLLVLLLMCAADQVAATITTGRLRALAWAGLWVGLAFQAKMLQAWLVLPAVLAALALTPRIPLARRVRGAGLLLAVTAVVSLSWMLAVSAVPQHDRPWVDGSRHDSVWEQVFVYNGWHRTDTTSPLGTGPAQQLEAAVTLDDVSRADRSVAGPGGRAVGWLLPLALLVAAVVLWPRRRGVERAGPSPERAAAAFWATWLVVDLAAFTTVSTINAYYLAALTPPIAALLGLGFVRARHLERRAVLLVAAAVVAYACWLLAPAPWPVRIAVPVLGAVLLVGGMLLRRLPAAALAAVLVAPAVAGVALVHEHGGPFTTPYEPAAQREVSQAGVARAVADAHAATPSIRSANAGTRYPAAAFTSLLAAPFVYADGLEILPIGGFTGTAPTPTLAELQRLVAAGELHTVLLVPSSDPRVEWVERTCIPVSAAAVRVYYCRA